MRMIENCYLPPQRVIEALMNIDLAHNKGES